MSALETLLFWVQMNNHPIYDRYLVDAYEEENGAHFDEEHARKAVSKMYHHGAGNELLTGEHWSLEEIKDAIAPYGLAPDDTIWDAYVALHTWWHDLGCQYKKRGAEDSLISDAITFFFRDEDACEGKIWRYAHMW